MTYRVTGYNVYDHKTKVVGQFETLEDAQDIWRTMSTIFGNDGITVHYRIEEFIRDDECSGCGIWQVLPESSPIDNGDGPTGK